ncbi:NACHT, LRR and PYD domains-containing protein 3-like [Engraulis encrasicolus]|uniref:NACHT, LRR and PYD domains-containing protein 3-like n=1 Tax=Engraulis encrasicolus TaxID=184585 RepID=UPI002FD51FC3
MKSDKSMRQPILFGTGDSGVKYKEICKLEILQGYKSHLQRKFQCLCEELSGQGNPTLLNDIYTDLYITKGDSGKVNDEHEVRQIELASKRSVSCDTQVKCNDIFRPLPGHMKPVRSVLTKGVAGIGKTVSVHKFILDWAEGKANEDVDFIFPLPFRELNLIQEKQLSMLDLVQHFFTDMKGFNVFSDDNYKVLFVLDGLDECRIPLDFYTTTKCCDVTEPTTLSALLTNLIKGTLLPSALLWITSRPAAASQIPPECVDQVTEVRGFNDPQKEEYFRKKVNDEDLANRTITHLKSSRSLYIMCHIPIFCWIAAIVLEKMLRATDRAEIPKTLTQMYIHFLVIQTHIKKKYANMKDMGGEMLFKLGKLAYQQLQEGNLIFYQKDLEDCNIDIREASVYSGVCTQIFREEIGLYQGMVFCFVHLSIQEHLAALYVHLSFIKQKENILKSFTSRSKLAQVFRPMSESLYDLHKSAVDLSFESRTGHLDLFLRFLLGLSLESNQNLLKDLQKTSSQPYDTETIVKYIKKKIGENASTNSGKFINLVHCLNELNDQSLVQEIQRYLTSFGLERANLSPAQWSAVAFVLLTSEEELDEFDLHKYYPSEECLLRLMPVVKASRSAKLKECTLTEKSCSSLGSGLSSGSNLKQMDLSYNDLLDSGVELLSVALGNPVCQLEKLEMWHCRLTEKSCSYLATTLSSRSNLRELDLSWNELKDSGVKFLSAALRNPLCQLKALALKYCVLTEKNCSSLASVLMSGSSLRGLDLSGNNLKDSGVIILSDALRHPQCQLKSLV